MKKGIFFAFILMGIFVGSCTYATQKTAVVQAAVLNDDKSGLENYCDRLKKEELVLVNTKSDRYINIEKSSELNKCELESVEYKGIVAMKIDDFDSDGKSELLVARIKTIEGLDTLSLTMYNKEMKKTGETVLTDKALIGDMFVNEIAYKKMGKETLIYFVADSDTTINTDGYYWCYNSVKYNAQGFFDKKEKTYAGTEQDEKTLKECTDFVIGDKIDIKSFTGKESFSKYDKDVILLCKISMEHTIDNLYKYIEDKNIKGKTKLKLGELYFKSY